MAVATASLLAGACTSPGTLTLRGPWTIPIPTINTSGPPTKVDLIPALPGTCTEILTPTGIKISGATLTVPQISVSIKGTIDVPNVQVNIPKLTVALPAVKLTCGSFTILNVALLVKVPASVFLKDANVDLSTGSINLVDPSVTVHGVSLVLSGTNFGLTIPITLTIPIPTQHIPLSSL
jgi:hypothetical protein